MYRFIVFFFTSLLYACIYVAPWSCEARRFVPLYVPTCRGMTIKLNLTWLPLNLKPQINPNIKGLHIVRILCIKKTKPIFRATFFHCEIIFMTVKHIFHHSEYSCVIHPQAQEPVFLKRKKTWCVLVTLLFSVDIDFFPVYIFWSLLMYVCKTNHLLPFLKCFTMFPWSDTASIDHY